MKLFLFPSVDELTERYHGGGGLVVIADDKAHAEAMISADGCIKPTEAEWSDVVEYEVGPAEARMFVFPDAGCC